MRSPSTTFSSVTDWRVRRSFRAVQFPLERLLAAKRESVGVVLPAREVAATIGPIALARPLLNLHAPELAVFDQPLAGEVAARRG
jgi:hypothetical protein